MQGPARATLLELVREFGALYVPRTAEGDELHSRSIKPDVDTLRRLAELLTPPADVDVDAWLEREIRRVREYVRDYAAICEADPEQARSWGGWMLEPRPIKGTTSAWTTLCRIVDRWREAQATARKEEREREAQAAAAERRAVDDRLAELEERARHNETANERALLEQLGVPARDHAADHAAALAAVQRARAAGRQPALAEVEAAVRATPPRQQAPRAEGPVRAATLLPDITPLPELPPTCSVAPGRDLQAGTPPERELSEEDEEQLRRQGRAREVQAARVHEEQRRQYHAAISKFCDAMGRSPTPAETNDIRRLFGVEGATGT